MEWPGDGDGDAARARTAGALPGRAMTCTFVNRHGLFLVTVSSRNLTFVTCLPVYRPSHTHAAGRRERAGGPEAGG